MAINRNFVCEVNCVDELGCAKHDILKPYPEQATGLCKSCSVRGCLRCDQADRCSKCSTTFLLRPDGTCEFMYARFFPMIYWVTAPIAVMVLIYIIYAAWMPAKRPLEISFGLLHHRRCLPRRSPTRSNGYTAVEAGDEMASEDPLFSIRSTNMHHDYVMGVGLALYYNWLVFLAIFFAILALGQGFVHRIASLDHVGSYLNLRDCAEFNLSDAARAQVLDFSEAQAHVGVIIATVAFFISVLFAAHQRRTTEMFRRRHCTMEDFALQLAGLPVNATDPDELSKWIKNVTGVEPIGVSISYKYDNEADLVDRLCVAHLQYFELLHDQQLHYTRRMASTNSQEPYSTSSLPSRSSCNVIPNDGQLSPMTVPDGYNIEDVRERLRSLPSTGIAYVAFNTARDRQKALDACELIFINDEYRNASIYAEPVNIYWENLHMSTLSFSLRLLRGIFTLSITFVIYTVLFFTPFC
ncbi:hypothetical protein FOL47_000636, partial [Perkinsus chesapeaki]